MPHPRASAMVAAAHMRIIMCDRGKPMAEVTVSSLVDSSFFFFRVGGDKQDAAWYGCGSLLLRRFEEWQILHARGAMSSLKYGIAQSLQNGSVGLGECLGLSGKN